MIAEADILVENMASGGIERLGFGYDPVRQINPRNISAQIKGFTPDGPYAKFLVFDMIAQSVGGAVFTTDPKGGHRYAQAPRWETRARVCIVRSVSCQLFTSGSLPARANVLKWQCRR